jgi:PEP-CTERM motif
MIKLRRLVCFAILTALATPALAATLTFVVSGATTDGYDQTGVFGSPDTILTGKPFSVSFQYDYDAGLAQSFTNGPVYGDLAGAFYGNRNPLSASVQLNNVTKAIEGTFSQEVYLVAGLKEPNFRYDRIAFFIRDGDPDVQTQQANSAYVSLKSSTKSLLGGPDPQLVSPFIQDLSLDSTIYIRFFKVNRLNFTAIDYAYISGKVSSLSLVSTSPVPEPSTWVLSIVGFGLLGGALRFQVKSRSAGFAIPGTSK